MHAHASIASAWRTPLSFTYLDVPRRRLLVPVHSLVLAQRGGPALGRPCRRVGCWDRGGGACPPARSEAKADGATALAFGPAREARAEVGASARIVLRRLLGLDSTRKAVHCAANKVMEPSPRI